MWNLEISWGFSETGVGLWIRSCDVWSWFGLVLVLGWCWCQFLVFDYIEDSQPTLGCLTLAKEFGTQTQRRLLSHHYQYLTNLCCYRPFAVSHSPLPVAHRQLASSGGMFRTCMDASYPKAQYGMNTISGSLTDLTMADRARTSPIS